MSITFLISYPSDLNPQSKAHDCASDREGKCSTSCRAVKDTLRFPHAVALVRHPKEGTKGNKKQLVPAIVEINRQYLQLNSDDLVLLCTGETGMANKKRRRQDPGTLYVLMFYLLHFIFC